VRDKCDDTLEFEKGEGGGSDLVNRSVVSLRESPFPVCRNCRKVLLRNKSKVKHTRFWSRLTFH